MKRFLSSIVLSMVLAFPLIAQDDWPLGSTRKSLDYLYNRIEALDGSGAVVQTITLGSGGLLTLQVTGGVDYEIDLQTADLQTALDPFFLDLTDIAGGEITGTYDNLALNVTFDGVVAGTYDNLEFATAVLTTIDQLGDVGSLASNDVYDIISDDFTAGAVSKVAVRFRESDIGDGFLATSNGGSPSEWAINNNRLENPSILTSREGEGPVQIMVPVSNLGAIDQPSYDKLSLSFDYTAAGSDSLYVHFWGFTGISDDDNEYISNLQVGNGSCVHLANPVPSTSVTGFNLVDGTAFGVNESVGSSSAIANGLTGSGTFTAEVDLKALLTPIPGVEKVTDLDYIFISISKDEDTVAGTTWIDNLSVQAVPQFGSYTFILSAAEIATALENDFVAGKTSGSILTEVPGPPKTLGLTAADVETALNGLGSYMDKTVYDTALTPVGVDVIDDNVVTSAKINDGAINKIDVDSTIVTEDTLLLGDVTGTVGANTVVKIQGVAVADPTLNVNKNLATDGSGNWIYVTDGGGDMTKLVYDTGDNAKVDIADSADAILGEGFNTANKAEKALLYYNALNTEYRYAIPSAAPLNLMEKTVYDTISPGDGKVDDSVSADTADTTLAITSSSIPVPVPTTSVDDGKILEWNEGGNTMVWVDNGDMTKLVYDNNDNGTVDTVDDSAITSAKINDGAINKIDVDSTILIDTTAFGNDVSGTAADIDVIGIHDHLITVPTLNEDGYALTYIHGPPATWGYTPIGSSAEIDPEWTADKPNYYTKDNLVNNDHFGAAATAADTVPGVNADDWLTASASYISDISANFIYNYIGVQFTAANSPTYMAARYEPGPINKVLTTIWVGVRTSSIVDTDSKVTVKLINPRVPGSNWSFVGMVSTVADTLTWYQFDGVVGPPAEPDGIPTFNEMQPFVDIVATFEGLDTEHAYIESIRFEFEEPTPYP